MSVDLNKLLSDFDSTSLQLEQSLPQSNQNKAQTEKLKELQQRLTRIQGLLHDALNKPAQKEKSGKDEKDKYDQPAQTSQGSGQGAGSNQLNLAKSKKPVVQAFTEVLDAASALHSKGMYWFDFTFNPTQEKTIFQGATSYEEGKNQWQLFLNPKKEYVASVLEAVLKVAKDNGIQLQGRVNCQDQLRRGLNDPTDTKIMLHFSDDAKDCAKAKFKGFVELLEQKFDANAIEELACDKGKREDWVEKEPDSKQFVKRESLQFGPAFTNMRNKLIFYSQGPQAERQKFAKTSYDGEKMLSLFEGKNSYLYKGESDPFGIKTVALPSSIGALPPKGYVTNWLFGKMKNMPKDEMCALFMECVRPHISQDNSGHVMPLFEFFVTEKLKSDFTFLEQLKTDCTYDEAEKFLMRPQVEANQWMLRYSKSQKEWIVARKEETKDGFVVVQHKAGSEEAEILQNLQFAKLQNLITTFLKKVIPSAPLPEAPFQPDPLQQIFLLSQLEALDKPSVKALVEVVLTQDVSFSSTSAAKPTVKMLQVEGERSTRLPTDDFFLDKAVARMIKWTEDQKIALEKMNKKDKEVYLERARQSSVIRLYEIAAAKLDKSSVTAYEVAGVTGRSVASLNAMRLQEVYKKVGSFDFKKIAQEASLSDYEVRLFLIESEKEVWLNNVLTELGGSYTEERKDVPLAELHPYLVDLHLFLEQCAKNTHLFSKPMQILKLHNLKRNLDLLNPLPAVSLEPFKVRCDELINRLIDGLSRTRKSALISLTQADSTPKELRDLIAKKTFSLAMTITNPFSHAPAYTYSQARGIHPKEHIEMVRQKAEETIVVVDEILANVSNYEAKQEKLPESIKHFCDHNRHDLHAALTVIRAKLKNMVMRQTRRLKLVDLGVGHEPAVYFHGTPGLETAMQIATTAIRPAHGKSFYGAFMSTFPAMLMYGDAIVGTTQTAALTSDVGTATSHGGRHRFRGQLLGGGRQMPLFMPDKRDDVMSGFRPKEKWIGLQDPIGINPKINELKDQLYKTLFQVLHARYVSFCEKTKAKVNEKEFSQFEAELLASFEKKHLLFSFKESNSDPSKGVWTAVIEDTYSVGNGQYINFGESQFKAHLAQIRCLKDFKADLEQQTKEFIEQVALQLVPEQKSQNSGSQGSGSNAQSQGLMSFLGSLLSQAGASSHAQYQERPLLIPGGRGVPYSHYLIAIDEEPALSKYFLNPMAFPSARHGNQVHKLDHIKDEYRRALGAKSSPIPSTVPDSEAKKIQSKMNQITELFVETHVVPLMEQMIEGDFSTQEGVRVLTRWVE